MSLPRDGPALATNSDDEKPRLAWRGRGFRPSFADGLRCELLVVAVIDRDLHPGAAPGLHPLIRHAADGRVDDGDAEAAAEAMTEAETVSTTPMRRSRSRSQRNGGDSGGIGTNGSGGVSDTGMFS